MICTYTKCTMIKIMKNSQPCGNWTAPKIAEIRHGNAIKSQEYV